MKITNQEYRKHSSQLTQIETNILIHMINTKKYILCDHANVRKIDKIITDKEIQETIKNGELVELHYKNGDSRVLLRNRKSYNGKNICVVLSLSRSEIVTVYSDSANDNHRTLNWRNYTNVSIYNILV